MDPVTPIDNTVQSKTVSRSISFYFRRVRRWGALMVVVVLVVVVVVLVVLVVLVGAGGGGGGGSCTSNVWEG